ncbi:hypothetical protein M8C21_020542 [Ambrosia artemisiifolia]|uniref:Uncharacterized protein n=1 Tax=Ambrosia artemisiifolia TaxID=4212 RepID=A0AAD5GES8_AMBAR|nr:hypothetical protein M8C21_020542 [Ambrosia artemisiifolia]
MVKTSIDQNGVKKGAWTEEEDNKLRAYIQRYGHWNWSLLPKFAGLSRNGKSCRLRWVNYLRPNVKHGNFTKEEDDLIVHLHNKLGNKWSQIAAKLPGRSDNEIKNRWNTHLKKRAQGDYTVLETDHHGTTTESFDQANQNGNHVTEQHEVEMNSVVPSSDSPLHCARTELPSCCFLGSDCGASSNVASQTSNHQLAEDFWTEPFLEDITFSVDSNLSPLHVVDDLHSSCNDMMMNYDELSWSMILSTFMRIECNRLGSLRHIFYKNGVKKGAWNEDEDDKLRTYIQRYGHWNWSLLPKFAGLSRSGKSCRLRWVNYLRPNMKHGNFSKEEDDMIVYLHSKLGNKWSMMAAKLPGRSDNEIKNRWNTHLKKRADDQDHIVLEMDHHGTNMEPIDQANPKQNPELVQQNENEGELSSCTRTELSSCLFSNVDSQTSNQLAKDFWTEPFIEDIPFSVDSILSPLNVVDNLIAQSSCNDMMSNYDEYSWSMLDSFHEYNEFINCWDSIQ